MNPPGPIDPDGRVVLPMRVPVFDPAVRPGRVRERDRERVRRPAADRHRGPAAAATGRNGPWYSTAPMSTVPARRANAPPRWSVVRVTGTRAFDPASISGLPATREWPGRPAVVGHGAELQVGPGGDVVRRSSRTAVNPVSFPTALKLMLTVLTAAAEAGPLGGSRSCSRPRPCSARVSVPAEAEIRAMPPPPVLAAVPAVFPTSVEFGP